MHTHSPYQSFLDFLLGRSSFSSIGYRYEHLHRSKHRGKYTKKYADGRQKKKRK